MKTKFKKRYLLPLLYLILEGLTFLVPALFPILFILLMPVMLIVNPLSVFMYGPKDTTYIIILGGIMQFFLLGYLWDSAVEYFHNKNIKTDNLK